MIQEHRPDGPVLEVLGTSQSKCVPDATWRTTLFVSFRYHAHNRPVQPARCVVTNRKFLGTTGKIDKTNGWIEAGNFPIRAYLHQRRLLWIFLSINSQEIDQLA